MLNINGKNISKCMNLKHTRRLRSEEQYQKDFIEKGELVCCLKYELEGGTNYELRTYDKKMAFVAFNSIKSGNSDRTWKGTKFIHIMSAHQIVFLLRRLHNDLGIDVQKKYNNSVV